MSTGIAKSRLGAKRSTASRKPNNRAYTMINVAHKCDLNIDNEHVCQSLCYNIHSCIRFGGFSSMVFYF